MTKETAAGDPVSGTPEGMPSFLLPPVVFIIVSTTLL